MHSALADLERFLHDTKTFPVLLHCAMAHAQFETIHPFIDGNGRIGRLLITFLLFQREILHRPLLYLSSYLKAQRVALSKSNAASDQTKARLLLSRP
jgi:Fic family protein